MAQAKFLGLCLSPELVLMISRKFLTGVSLRLNRPHNWPAPVWKLPLLEAQLLLLLCLPNGGKTEENQSNQSDSIQRALMCVACSELLYYELLRVSLPGSSEVWNMSAKRVCREQRDANPWDPSSRARAKSTSGNGRLRPHNS